jgi:hypothetical protein
MSAAITQRRDWVGFFPATALVARSNEMFPHWA